jgi:predicted nucleotidyltransferase
MGHKLTKASRSHAGHTPSWLDTATSALVEDVIDTLTDQRSDVLAIILYGSIARHDERPLDDPSPSDVDLLVVFDTEDEAIAIHQGEELFRILGMAYDRHVDSLRDVKVMFASRTLSEWDETFVANVAQDGLVLWASGSLPPPLANARHRTVQSDSKATSKRAQEV